MTSPNIGHVIEVAREQEQYRQGFIDGAAQHVLAGADKDGSVMGRAFTLRVEWAPLRSPEEEAVWQRNVDRFKQAIEQRSAAAHR